ncbi:uncharacterized protein LOC142234624 isoform X1 [Haematobia irritans]|uniref:uncharacterized protein LOC142234624 isoform X1 n=1 Tax=Haematobia irritans TaxID=7368 RepID=UPI003F5069F9
MSCISSNFSSFFLNSLNDPSEFSKYLSNGELRFSSFEDFQVYNNSSASQQQYQQQQPQIYHMNGGGPTTSGDPLQQGGDEGNSNLENTHPTGQQHHHHMPHPHQQQPNHYIGGSYHPQNHGNGHPLMHLQQHQQRWTPGGNAGNPQQGLPPPSSQGASNGPVSVGGAPQHFDGSFEFMKYLRHSNDYNDNQHHPGHNSSASGSGGPTAIGTKPDPSLNANNASLIDLDTTPHKVSRSSRKTPANHHGASNANSSNHQPPTPMAVDVYDHDSKHMLYDLHHMNSVHSSNSNESSMELSSLTYPNSHLNASNSNTSSEGGNNHGGHSDFSMLGVAGGGSGTTASSGGVSSSANGGTDAAANASPAVPKVLANFSITENFEAHPSHKVEEGIFQHMNKLPGKKKDNLKSLGVRFTGQMTLNDKMIIVDNFIRFCQEYDIQDHRPFLSLNQSGLNKPDQIKFARYLGQGLPTFTLFCIYSNFKNLFCTKRTEIYTKDGYNLPYILEKTKSFLANTAAGTTNSNAPTTTTNKNTTTTTNTSSSTSTSTAAVAAAPSASSSNTDSSNTNPTINSTSESSNNSTVSNNTINNPSTVDNNESSAANMTSSETSSAAPVPQAAPAVVTNGITAIGHDHANGNLNGNAANDVIQTPTKQKPLANVPSTPVTPYQGGPHNQGPSSHLPTSISRPQTPTSMPLHHNPQLHQTPTAPNMHHHVVVQRPPSMPMSPMVVVSSANMGPTATIIGSPLPPNGQQQHTATASNHMQHHPHHHQQHQIQHPYHHHPPPPPTLHQQHMQQQLPNHMPPHHSSQIPNHHNLQHQQHLAPNNHNGNNGGTVGSAPYPLQQQQHQIMKPPHHQQQQQHPLQHNAAQNPSQ